MTIEEAIKTALQYENRVVGVYEEAARASVDPTGKKIFDAFVKEEKQHVQYLKERLAEWKQTGRVSAAELNTFVPPRSRVDEAIQSLRVKAAVKAPESEMRLLKRALDIEIETSNYYIGVVKQLPPEGQTLFARFVEIEQGHQAIVQAEMNAVAGNGYWFDIPEITMEG